MTVEGGKGVRLRGNPAHPVTRGFLCGKVARYLEREYAPDRLLYPMKRVDYDPNGERNPQNRGKSGYVRISWDEAIKLVTD